MKNVFYVSRLLKVGGVETFIYELVKKHHKEFDITVLYNYGDAKQIERLSKYVKIKKYNGENIKCDKCYFFYNYDIIDKVDGEKIGMINDDFKALGIPPKKHDKIDRYIAVSKLVADNFGENAKIIYNPITIEDEKEPLLLVSATRLSGEKGPERIEKLSQILDENDIKYLWLIFTGDSYNFNNENIVLMKPRLDIRPFIKKADYLVQLSDGEAYCYSIVEALMQNTPIITTNIKILKELGITNEHGIIVDFDLNNFNVDDLFKEYNFNFKPPKSNWSEEMAKGKSSYELILVKATSKWQEKNVVDNEIGRVRKQGEEFYITPERFKQLSGDNSYNEVFVKRINARTSKKNKFSIIMPNRNNGKLLKKSIGSILEQSYTNYEIIFVDDMSEDKSVEIAKKLIDKKGKVIELPQRRLNGGARNVGILKAKGDYIVFLDSDDWFADKDVLKDYNKELNNEDVMFVDLLQDVNGILGVSHISNYKTKYDAMASLHGGACMKIIKTDFAKKHLFNEGTLMEDRNHHSRICYYMEKWKYYKRFGAVYNKNNPNSTTNVRDNILWGTSKWRNYADALSLLEEIKLGNDKRAIEIMNHRIIGIESNLKRNDQQH